MAFLSLWDVGGNVGLTEAVKRALNAVQKNGDTMTGNLFLKGDARLHFSIANEDGNVRMWLYKDKGGDGVRLNNGIDGGGEFVFHKNGEFYSPSSLHSGAAALTTDGNINGSLWGGWLNNWLNGQLVARDNAINTRAPTNTAALAVSGWFKDSSTGWIMQWGLVPFGSLGTITVNLPIPFPRQGFMAMGTGYEAVYWGNDGVSGSVKLLNNSQLSVTLDNNLPTVWFAIGC
ncbi:hypothetical protein MDN60_002707 [Salmonella enterica]|nr:hypothetical protein [Salmonella enterica]EIW4274090.1 hypothetical protein [Salmonella enterica]